MKSFTTSYPCLSGHHCVSCRDPGKVGVDFRDDKLRFYGEDLAVCPHGRPMGYGRVEPVCRGYGDRLHAIIAREIGAIACSECRKEILRLNDMTRAEIEGDRENIATGIVDRAATDAPHFYQRLGVRLVYRLVVKRVHAWVDETLEMDLS